MGQRVTGVEESQASIFLQPLYAGCKKIYGSVVTSLKVQARRPGIAWAGSLLGIAIEKSKKVEARIHILAQLRVAQIVECPF